MTPTFNCSFRCFYDGDEGAVRFTTHYQSLPLEDIPRWLEAYHFTHPACTSISCKVWFAEENRNEI